MKKVMCLIGGIMVFVFFFAPLQASAVTQGDYAVALAEELGLGKGLTAEGAVEILTKVGIVPSEGWQIAKEVTCELVAEVQDLVIEAAQRGLIRYEPEEVPDLMASLSERLGCCTPPSVIVYPRVPITPPMIAVEMEEKGESVASPWR